MNFGGSSWTQIARTFGDLLTSTHFEAVAKGRRGAVLVRPHTDGSVPIVRTTTKYKCESRQFQPTHITLAEQIQRLAGLPIGFNNALAEVYTNDYAKMGFHSDQAQDLLDGTYIAVFSCYRNPGKPCSRKLVIEPKDGNSVGERFEMELSHNSVVIFSLDTNRRFRHKIVLGCSTSGPPEENDWIGVTFRTSKTFVRFEEGKALLEDGTPLRKLDTELERDYFKLRGCENREVLFQYPFLDYTISDSDLMPPVD